MTANRRLSGSHRPPLRNERATHLPPATRHPPKSPDDWAKCRAVGRVFLNRAVGTSLPVALLTALGNAPPPRHPTLARGLHHISSSRGGVGRVRTLCQLRVVASILRLARGFSTRVGFVLSRLQNVSTGSNRAQSP